MSYGRITELVLAHLKEVGPRMRFQIEQDLGLPQRTLGTTMGFLTSISKIGPSKGLRRAHICGWCRHTPGVGRATLPRPIYAAGHGANAPKPQRISSTEHSRRWRAKKRAEHVSELQG